MNYILSIDVGTSNVRALLLDTQGEMIAIAQKTLSTLHPFHGHTEMNPEKIISSTMNCIENVLIKANATKEDIKGIGIANARETTIVWDKTTGKPLWNAILWHDIRSKEYCAKHKDKEELIRRKTGLFLTSYASATKIRWILQNAKIENLDNCLFGNINTWLLWNLTGGKVFATDVTNAARTLLYDIEKKNWDDELLDFFEVPKSMLPKVLSNCEVYGETDRAFFGAQIKICAMIGDAQSAFFAAGCHKENDTHLSLGTGGFLLKNTGTTRTHSNGDTIMSTIALQLKDGEAHYCEEGAVLSIGSVVEWLKTHMGIIRSAKEIEGLAYSVPDSFGVYFVPTIHGGGKKAGENIRGSFLGLSSSTNIGHICRGVLEGISFMLYDLSKSMEGSTKIKLKCSGGVAENIFLLQMIANLLEIDIVRSSNLELSAYGAAYLTGICLGVWKDEKEIATLFSADREFNPSLSKEDKEKMLRDWKKAFSATSSFSN